jgi:predicted lactoylglutathione lyase
MPKMIFVNLPDADLGTSMAFYKSFPRIIKQLHKNNRRNP